MGLIKNQENRIRLVMSKLHYDQPMSKSRVAYECGLHYFVAEDILEYLVNEGKVTKEDGKFKLVKEDKGGSQ